MRFDRAFELVVGHEGRFSADRQDPGNWTGDGEFKGTKFGISAKQYPDLDIKNISLDEAKEIYRTDYWNVVHGDELPPGLAYVVFDAQINTGRGVRWLQEAAGTAADGKYGPNTRKTVASGNPERLMRDVNALRLDHYMQLDRLNDINGLGWARRVLDVDRAGIAFAADRVDKPGEVDQGALVHALVAAVIMSAVAGAALVTGLAWLLWAGVVANTIGWPLREALQRRAKGKAVMWSFSKHKRAEAFAPVASGAAIAFLALAAI